MLTGKGASDQCGHNAFQVEVDGSKEYIRIAIGSDGWRIHVFHGSHLYIWYHKSRNKKPAEILQMEEVIIAPFSLFVGRGHLQHARAGLKGKTCIRYHTYISPVRDNLTDVIASAYGASLKERNRKASTMEHMVDLHSVEVAQGAEDNEYQVYGEQGEHGGVITAQQIPDDSWAG